MISQEKAGGDATENDDFQIGKQRLQGTIFFLVRWGRLHENFVLANEAIASFARTRNSHALALEVSVYL